MPIPSRSARQVAEKYKGNLDYFRKPHAFRVLRAICFVIAAVGSIAAALGFRHFGGKQSFYNTAPLSANRAQFANRCEVCHEGARPDLAEALRLDKAAEKLRAAKGFGAEEWKRKAGETLPVAADHAVSFARNAIGHVDPARVEKSFNGLVQTVLAKNQLSQFDKACIKCHPAYQLHQPQAAALGLQPVSREIALVHAGSCSDCHKEHCGPDTMKLPASNICQDCHSDRARMRSAITLIKANGDAPGPRGDVRDFGDGLRRFIPPRAENHQPVAFKSFAEGHPAFGYEQPGLRDPAAIRYNHARHEQPDIPQLHGRELACADCHKPGADGVFMQPIKYEAHCARCHSLHFDPDVPQMMVPHGDPEKVRIYLRTLGTQYSDFAKNNARVSDRAQLRLYVETQLSELEARGITDVQELERRVFFTGDPPVDQTRLAVKSNKAQFFGACAKCHDVLPPEGSGRGASRRHNRLSAGLRGAPLRTRGIRT